MSQDHLESLLLLLITYKDPTTTDDITNHVITE